MGLKLDSFITGPFKLTIKEDKLGKPQKISLDLTDAKLTLPWINWSKNAGISAIVQLERTQKSNISTLSKMELSGDGFFAKGQMTFDQKGILKARFTDVKLHPGDHLQMSIKRTAKGYDIEAHGQQFDARDLVNSIVDGTLPDDQENNATINLHAKLETMVGFGNQKLRHVNLRYVSGTPDATGMDFDSRFPNRGIVYNEYGR